MGTRKEQKDALSRFFFDLGKVTFTTAVLGSLVLASQSSKPIPVILIIVGAVVTFALVLIGYKLLK
jgi:hypothetical protein